VKRIGGFAAYLYPICILWSVADPEGKGTRGHSPKLMTILRKAVRVAVVVTQCFDDDVGTWK